MNQTELLLVLRSLKDSLHAFVSNGLIQSVASENSELAMIVEEARSLRNLIEATCREIDPDWHED